MTGLKKISAFLLALTASLSVSCSGDGNSVHFAPTGSETWTFMIYLAADNSLDGYDDLDVQEIKNGLASSNNPNINVIILQDKSGSGDSAMYRAAYNTWEQLDDGGTGTGHTPALVEVNTGDPSVLSDFISHCKTYFAADHYALIIWNHGSGSRKKSTSTTSITKAIAEDDTSSDILYMDEVQQALAANFSSSSKLDVIGFDACLMGTVEVAYEMKYLASYMIASMASEWAYGWDYGRIFSSMTNDDYASPDPVLLAGLGVSTYRDSTKMYSDQTMSAVDLSQIDSLTAAVNSFAAALCSENKQSTIEATRNSSTYFYTSSSERVSFPYYDLGSFAAKIAASTSYSSNLRNAAQNVLASLADAVVTAYAGSYYGGYYGDGGDVYRGLSIFFSYNETDYSSQWWYTSRDTTTYGSTYLYGKLDFCTFDSDGTVENWKELMEYWYDYDGTRNSDTW